MNINWQKIGIKELSAVISEKLRENGIDTILVGGACVSIYTENQYQSFDLDFVTHATFKEIAPVLAEVGFHRESARHFMHPDCPFFIEFVAPPVAIGNEPIRGTKQIKTTLGTIVLLKPTDSVKDRLAAYYHWNDPQSLEQALMIAKAQKINHSEIRRWSIKEGQLIKYKTFFKRIQKKD